MFQAVKCVRIYRNECWYPSTVPGSSVEEKLKVMRSCRDAGRFRIGQTPYRLGLVRKDIVPQMSPSAMLQNPSWSVGHSHCHCLRNCCLPTDESICWVPKTMTLRVSTACGDQSLSEQEDLVLHHPGLAADQDTFHR